MSTSKKISAKLYPKFESTHWDIVVTNSPSSVGKESRNKRGTHTCRCERRDEGQSRMKRNYQKQCCYECGHFFIDNGVKIEFPLIIGCRVFVFGEGGIGAARRNEGCFEKIEF